MVVLKSHGQQGKVSIESSREGTDWQSGYPIQMPVSVSLTVEEARDLLKRLPEHIETAAKERKEIKDKKRADLERELRSL